MQSLSIPTHDLKNLSIDFVIGLLLLIDWNNDSYDAILVVIDYLMKIMYYKPVKSIIDAADLAKIIINMIIKYHNLPESIINN